MAQGRLKTVKIEAPTRQTANESMTSSFSGFSKTRAIHSHGKPVPPSGLKSMNASIGAGPVSAHLRRVISQEMPPPLKSILVKKRGFSDPSSDSNTFPATPLLSRTASRVSLLYSKPRFPSSFPRFLDTDQLIVPEEFGLHDSRVPLRITSLTKELETTDIKPRPRIVTTSMPEYLASESKLPDMAFTAAVDTCEPFDSWRSAPVVPSRTHSIKTQEKSPQNAASPSLEINSKHFKQSRKTSGPVSMRPIERNKTSSSRPVVVSDDRTLFVSNHDLNQPTSLLDDVSSTPVPSSHPSVLTTYPLRPQIHKVVQGQLSILPSLSVLADFREGERRKGFRGDKVLVISPNGYEVKVFAAPHLSLPCCLAEPTTQYTLDTLPEQYWQLYEDVGAALDSIKKRTPMFVNFTPQAKCTLMANQPLGDVEIITPPPTSTTDKKKRFDPATNPENCLRLRLLSQRTSLEIASYSSSKKGPEWSKKVIPFSPRILQRSHGLPREPAKALKNFLTICDSLLDDSPIKPDFQSSNVLTYHTPYPHPGSPVRETRIESKNHSPNALSFSFRTHFIPSVGWCLQNHGGARYHMMFLDGSLLEVDVNEEWVELQLQDSQERIRYKMGRGGRAVGDRLKHFGRFIKMFESDNNRTSTLA